MCNNDATIKVFELRGLCYNAGGVLRCASAVNYAALSPDGGHLVAVGDSSDAYLFKAVRSAGFSHHHEHQ